MKTAMMQLREWLEQGIKINDSDNDTALGIRIAYQITIERIDSQMMEVEMKQIVRAFQNGYDNKQISHDYYTQTFTNK